MEAPETQGKRTVFMILVSSCVFLCAESQKMEAISGQYVDLYLFCAVCINYRLNLLHKGIIVVLVINSAEHWFAYNIAISVNKYSCWKCHDFWGIFTGSARGVNWQITIFDTLAFKNRGSLFDCCFIAIEVSVLMPTTSPPIDLIASFNSLSWITQRHMVCSR